jgi:retinol dehydrogenase-12
MVGVERDLAGKLFVITGANTGIGRSTAIALAKRGARTVLACRSEERARPVLDAIAVLRAGPAQFVSLDLADFESVRACAAEIKSWGRPVDVLINNAGVAGQRGMTKDGFELHFGVNHLGHFLFTTLLAPCLLSAHGGARVVTVSSQAHYNAKGIDYALIRGRTRSITGLPEYAVSKLANVLFTRELPRRVGAWGVRSYALHPGVVASDAWRRMPWPIRPLIKLRMISNDEGAKTSLYCATSPEVAGEEGLYYDACLVKAPSEVALRDDLAKELWDKSIELTSSDLETRS